MRIMNAVAAIAVSAAIVACSTSDSPTGPSGIRGPAHGVNAESPNGAWVTLTGPCNMVGSDANGNLILGGAGAVSTKVENNNKLMITCKGTGITNLSDRTQVFRGFACTILGLKDGGAPHPTTDSHATVTREGNATLTCSADL
jgi:hypothetical protein